MIIEAVYNLEDKEGFEKSLRKLKKSFKSNFVSRLTLRVIDFEPKKSFGHESYISNDLKQARTEGRRLRASNVKSVSS